MGPYGRMMWTSAILNSLRPDFPKTGGQHEALEKRQACVCIDPAYLQRRNVPGTKCLMCKYLGMQGHGFPSTRPAAGCLKGATPASPEGPWGALATAHRLMRGNRAAQGRGSWLPDHWFRMFEFCAGVYLARRPDCRGFMCEFLQSRIGKVQFESS